MLYYNLFPSLYIRARLYIFGKSIICSLFIPINCLIYILYNSIFFFTHKSKGNYMNIQKLYEKYKEIIRNCAKFRIYEVYRIELPFESQNGHLIFKNI